MSWITLFSTRIATFWPPIPDLAHLAYPYKAFDAGMFSFHIFFLVVRPAARIEFSNDIPSNPAIFQGRLWY
jgi:hypothetical protein